MKQDVYQSITDRIVSQLEQGVRPWQRPWDAGHLGGRVSLPRRHNGVAYRGVNVLTLWLEALDKGYTAPTWMTFKQAIDLGGAVRKGEKGSLTVYADKIIRNAVDAETGEEGSVEIPYMKGYTVFNVEQVDGLPVEYYAKAEPRGEALPRIKRAERYFAATGAALSHGGNLAFYAVGPDRIQMPPFEAFRDAESYYAVLAHEFTHWTRHPSRLDRSFGRKRWGDEGYAMEELVAELGSAFLCADLNLTPEVRDDHAAYVATWLKVLKDDKRAIFSAAAHAQRAADFLHGMQTADEEGMAAYGDWTMQMSIMSENGPMSQSCRSVAKLLIYERAGRLPGIAVN